MSLTGKGVSYKLPLRVKNGNGLGGDPESFQKSGLNLSYAVLIVLVDAATTANRGLYVSENSDINVDSGNTIRWMSPLEKCFCIVKSCFVTL